jgi:alkanesulfonate monooxygenase SsuD/methylene tetrahydromethanopterin reductase-like flavin-dependent oxidoreductase (luciferase family)
MDAMTAPEAAVFARPVEEWGYAALWMGDGFGRDVLLHSSWLLANTSKLIVASGIVSIYGRDAVAMAVSKATLCEQSGGRFILGMRVSHERIVEGRRGHLYGKPVSTMREYLDCMDGVDYQAPPPPPERPVVVLAALGPKMLNWRANARMARCRILRHAGTYQAGPRVSGAGQVIVPWTEVVAGIEPA